MTRLFASDAWCPPGPPAPGWIAVDDGVIVDLGRGRAPGGTRRVEDLGAAVLAPGFVDLQCNGVGADDFAAGEAAGWERAAVTLAGHGTTSYCATLISASLESYGSPLRTAQTVRDAPAERGANLLGVHLEGPFLGGAPGAHDPDLLRTADTPWLRDRLTAYPGVVRIVTLAPEADPGFMATRLLVDAGIVVALGHSRASCADALAAADAGATVVTHLFNGMEPLHHREPGLAGAALDDDRLTPTLIADGVHVHPVVLRLALARKRNVALVSDAVAVTDGVVARDGAAYLVDGTLTGAIKLLDEGVATLVRSGIPIERAVEVATAVPAHVLGLLDRGRLAVGTRADFVSLDPETLAVRATWIGGERVAGNIDA